LAHRNPKELPGPSRSPTSPATKSRAPSAEREVSRKRQRVDPTASLHQPAPAPSAILAPAPSAILAPAPAPSATLAPATSASPVASHQIPAPAPHSSFNDSGLIQLLLFISLLQLLLPSFAPAPSTILAPAPSATLCSSSFRNPLLQLLLPLLLLMSAIRSALSGGEVIRVSLLSLSGGLVVGGFPDG
ncbi:hypothetical protein CEXT_718341, partial [Caerostris extrusa]